jgi:hypothetical protein
MSSLPADYIADRQQAAIRAAQEARVGRLASR